MKLYLSSYGLGNNPQKLLDLVGNNKKVAVIPNALDFSKEIERRNLAIKKEIDELKELGLDPEEVNLKDYFGKSEELAQKIKDFGVIWVRGGNVFTLRQAYKASGMDEWLISQKDNNDLVYGGYSAGVCVLSPTLVGLDIVDDPNVVSEGYPQGIIWEGLGLIDFAFAPHYLSDHPESESVSREVEYYKEKGIKYEALRDGEVIIKEDENHQERN